MSVFLTFPKGGIHPADKKSLSKNSAIQKLPMPKELVVSMSQHLGAPATLLKQKGDRVELGEKIGQASGFISADVHSPASGTITDVKKVTLANSVCCDAVVIQTDDVQPDKFNQKIDWNNLSVPEILSIFKDKGVVGQGGATFPGNVKLSIPQDKAVDYLIINGVECEPYLTSDYRLMIEKPEELLTGAMIIAKAISPKQVFVGVEANKMDAVQILSEKAKSLGFNINVQPLKMKYPQGDEKQLIKAITNREIPSGKLPLDVGTVVVNAGSTYSIYNAVVYCKPVIERIVTVSGECINRPCNILAPIGTKISELIKFADGFKKEPDKIISGGPMMGFALYDEETPITKGTSGITCINDEKDHRQTACLSCGRCVAACPIGLEPTKMYHNIVNGQYAEAMKLHLMDCKECGCCAFSCPAHLDLVHAFKTGKKMGRKK